MNDRIRRSTRLVFAGALLAQCSSAFAQAASERDGLQLYEDYGCVLCHGIGGHRGGPGGRPIAPTAHSFESFSALMRFPANSMPAYAEEYIGEEQLRQVYDYLRSIEASPAATDIPSVKAMLDALDER